MVVKYRMSVGLDANKVYVCILTTKTKRSFYCRSLKVKGSFRCLLFPVSDSKKLHFNFFIKVKHRYCYVILIKAKQRKKKKICFYILTQTKATNVL